jgi:phosphatidylinositol 3-kinase
MSSFLYAVQTLALRLSLFETQRYKALQRLDCPSPRSSRSMSISSLSDSDSCDTCETGQYLRLLDAFIDSVSAKEQNVQYSLYWALVFETEDHRKDTDKLVAYLYKSLLESVRGETWVEGLLSTSLLVKEVLWCVKSIGAKSAVSRNVYGRDDELRALLDEKTSHFFSYCDRIVLSPILCNQRLVSIHLDSCKYFASSRSPALLQFVSRNLTGPSAEERAGIMFKYGDDLRLDLFALQLMGKSNDLLLSVGLDLEVQLYGVLPTGPLEGCIQFLSAVPLSSLRGEGSILAFLDGISVSGCIGNRNLERAVSNFIRSCAFYCVTTYIFGVGDRHLDNILLCNTTGRIVHIGGTCCTQLHDLNSYSD